METSESSAPKSKSGNVSVHEKELAIMKLELLKKISFFKCLSHEVMLNVMAESKDIILKDQEILFAEGSDNCNLYVILSGKILIAKGPNYTKYVTILSEGECLGEISLIDKRPRSASAVALGGMVLNRSIVDKSSVFNKISFCSILRSEDLSESSLKLRETSGSDSLVLVSGIFHLINLKFESILFSSVPFLY